MKVIYCEKLKENHFMIVCGDCENVLLEETHADSLTEVCQKLMGFTECSKCKCQNLILTHHFTCCAKCEILCIKIYLSKWEHDTNMVPGFRITKRASYNEGKNEIFIYASVYNEASGHETEIGEIPCDIHNYKEKCSDMDTSIRRLCERILKNDNSEQDKNTKN